MCGVAGPIFINMWYGGTGAAGYANSLIGAVTPNVDGLLRQYPGVSVELAEELGALIISVPNRYYGKMPSRRALRHRSTTNPHRNLISRDNL